MLWEATENINVFIQEAGKSRATRFTLSFLYFLPILPGIMDCMCGAAVVLNTKKTKTDTGQEKKRQK